MSFLQTNSNTYREAKILEGKALLDPENPYESKEDFRSTQ
jgi:Na+-driven multidrug efflux pump